MGQDEIQEKRPELNRLGRMPDMPKSQRGLIRPRDLYLGPTDKLRATGGEDQPAEKSAAHG